MTSAVILRMRRVEGFKYVIVWFICLGCCSFMFTSDFIIQSSVGDAGVSFGGICVLEWEVWGHISFTTGCVCKLPINFFIF